ncbi:MAG: hypothetical protein EPN97_00720 [Alphaproteobacteria bacterium]|nr:MAG: hypothetical protein EPN97_00720 [Alphaproteobacteria bacterium]
MKTCISFISILLLASAAAQADQPIDHGTFARSCAPWDGSAVRFELTPADGQYPQIGFSLWTSASNIATGSYDLPLDSKKGNVNYCTAQGKCVLVNKGTVELIEFTAWTTARISYDVTLDDGTALKGEATLTGKDERTFCG